ncbi:MAG: DegT/DnrJ/EryC1/StrS family aminotransferase [Acidobacteriota bacterium]
MKVPFNALTPGEDAGDIKSAIDRVIASGWFVLGPEVEAFESEFAAASGVNHAVGVGNGTDAIMLILRGLDIGPGDEVIMPPLSAAFSALAVMMTGARPVFADIDPERLTLDPAAAAAAITPRTRAILPVHLYGQPAEMKPLEALAATSPAMCPACDRVCSQVVSLPMYPGLSDKAVTAVAEAAETFGG